MDRFSDYLEMALGQVHYDPDLRTKLFQVIKINQKFAEVMKRLPGIVFNVFFVPVDFKLKDENSDPNQSIKLVAGKLGMNMSTAINCVVTENFFNKYQKSGTVVGLPASAWGRVHRICHGLIKEYGNRPQEFQQSRNDLFIRMKKFFVECRKEKIPMTGFQFKSFRDNTNDRKTGIEDETEFYREVLSEYIWTGGKIRYQPSGEKPQEQVQAIEKLQELLDQGLKELVGQIIFCDS